MSVKCNELLQAEPYRLLQAGLDHIDQGIAIFDAGLKLVGWNRRFVQLLGFPSEMTRLGADYADFIRFNAERGEYGPGDVEEQITERVRAAATFRRHYVERVRPNGSILAAQGTPLPGGGFVTVYTDITDQRLRETLTHERNEELESRVNQRTMELRMVNEELRNAIAIQQQAATALKTSEERLRLITDAVPACIGYVDHRRRVTFSNRRYAELFNFAADDIVGRTLTEVFGERLHARLSDYVEAAFAGKSVDFHHRYKTADGRAQVTYNNLIPELAADGRTLGIFVLSIDVTEEKKAEEALHEAQKMTAIGQLAGGLAHDFNNLLTVIIGNLCSLKEQPGAKELAEDYLEPAIRAGYRGVDITKRLLAFARDQPLESVAVDAGDLVCNTARLLRRSLPSTIEITCKKHEDVWPALADPGQFENAIVNLALNARDAMPDGGKLNFEISSLTVAEDGAFGEDAAPGDYVKIAVTDSGRGFDDATLARAFEPFFTTKPFSSGSGLGLSMVYGFVRQSGGHIGIDSAVGQGTCVTVLLPRAVGIAATEALRVEPVLVKAGGELALLAEDNDDVRLVVRRQLMELGYNVLEAADGVEAAALLEAVPDIAVLVSDVIMPGGVSGLELAALAHDRKPEIKVVLVSGFAGEDFKMPPAAEGLPLLRKPFDKKQLFLSLHK